VEDEETNIYQRCWEETSGGKYSLTEEGLRDMRNLAERYSSDMIFEAIRIAWGRSHIPPDSKFRYMCGVLKNMRLQLRDPEKAKAMYAVNRCLALAKREFAYANERFLRVYIPRIPEDVFQQMVSESRSWTYLKESILAYCNDAED
jgi:hypothetical protein